MINRRSFIATLLAAPVIIRTPGSLMAVRPARWTAADVDAWRREAFQQSMTEMLLYGGAQYTPLPWSDEPWKLMAAEAVAAETLIAGISQQYLAGGA